MTAGVKPTFVHDCEECVYLGTVTRSETILVTDDVAAALTEHVLDEGGMLTGTATIADLNKAMGVKPPEVFDLYFCQKGGNPGLNSTVIARYGDEGHEYKSGVIFHARDPDLGLAYRLARKLGLLPVSP